MNARDSEKLGGILTWRSDMRKRHLKTNADFVIFNTCTVRENANMRVYGRTGTVKAV